MVIGPFVNLSPGVAKCPAGQCLTRPFTAGASSVRMDGGGN